jgi:iron uptake system EfeUOB component EfeO/EfeM
MHAAIRHALAGSSTRLRKQAKLVGGAVALALIVVVAAAAAPSGANSRTVVGRHDVAVASAHQTPLDVRVTRVFGSAIPANRYGHYVALLEAGVNASGQFVSDLDPIAPHALTAPENRYRAYAERWAHTLQARVSALQSAIASSDRARSKRAWEDAWSSYLHLGAVYGLFGSLDRRIDGVPALRGSATSHFTGLHRIEMGLWTGTPLPRLRRLIAPLRHAVERLPHVIATVPISPLDYVLRGHEILEDAQRDLVSGVEVPWSGQGVLGLAAGLAATQEVVRTLTPLMRGRDNTLIEVDNELIVLHRAIARIRRQHAGTWPSLSDLTLGQRETLDSTLAGTLSALAQIPGTLETAVVQPFPRLP